MVFESIITDVVNRFLGDYIENLDKKQLNLGIWGGDVVLKDLLVKASAFEDLDLPIQVVYGRLGKLILKVPWKNLYGSPVEAVVEDLYILVAPNSAVVYNAEKETKRAKEVKQAELLKIEEAKKLELEKDKPKERPDQSFTEKLVAQIINNVQIRIKNVHIRYEDRSTAATPFSVGITLSEFSVHTTDEDWNKCFLKEQASKIFKVAVLEGLSVYLNCNSKMYLQHTVEEYPNLFVKGIATKDFTPDNGYVLGPINSFAKLQLNMNPEYDSPPFKIPKILLSFDMEKLAVGITRAQYQSLMRLADGMGTMARAAPYRKYRPFGIPYKGNYKKWWLFAYECILETEIRRQTNNWSWEHIKNHRQTLVTYAAAYKTKLTSKKPPADCLAICERCEDQLDLMNLSLVRQRVDLEVQKSGKEAKEQQAQSSGWFSGWFGSKTADTNNQTEDKDILHQFKSAMTAEEKEKLCQAIGYEEGATKTELPDDYVAISANFTLKLLEVCVRSEVYDATETIVKSLEEIVTLKLSGVSLAAHQRPSTNGLLLDVNMKEFAIYGYRQDDYLPVLVKSKTEGERALLDIQFEMNPLDGLCDQRVSVCSRPLQIVYDAQTIIQVLHVFKLPTNTNLSELQDAASNKLSNISERSATGIQYMIEKHTRLDVNIELMPNYILIPYGGAYAKNKVPVIVVSLGKIMFKSEPRPLVIKDVASMATSGASSQDILKEMMSQSYDKFNLSIQDIQILLARPTESWKDALNGVITEMHMLEPTSVELSAHMCVVGDDPRLPKMRFGGKIPSIGISISDDRALEALSLVTSIPLPQNDEPVAAPTLKRDSIMSSTLSLKKYLEDRHKKPKKPEGIEIGEEIVQYTDMEVHFELQEVSLTVYKAKEYRETPSDEYQTPTEEFQSGSLSSKRFSEVVSEADDTAPEKLLTFKVQQLEMAMIQRTYDMNVTLKLGAICMDQHTRLNGKETTLTMVHTPQFHDAGSYLFSLSFIQANKISPEFTTKYKSTEQLIDINFAILKLRLHQEGLRELLQIANSFQQKLESINKKNETLYRVAYADDGLHLPAVPGFLATISEEPTAGDVAQQSTSSRRGKVVDSVKMKVLAHLEHFAIQLEDSKRPIANLIIENVNASVVMKSSYTEVGVVLQDIQVIDLNPETKHPTILSVVGGNALSCQLVLYNLDETAVYNSDNMKIDISMGCVKIVFLNWFVSSVLNFLDNFQEAQRAIAEASAAAADAAKQNVVDAYANATRMKLNLKIKAPLIIVPVDSKSMEAIAVDLGFLCISNTCMELAGTAEERGPAVLDEMKLEMRDMKLSKIKICKPENIQDISFSRVDGATADSAYGIKNDVNLLNPTSFALLIKRNLSASWYKKLPELDISGRLNSIVLNILGDDYKMIMLILSKNMSEGASERKTPPAPPRPSMVPPISGAAINMPVSSDLRKQSRMEPSDDNDEVKRRSTWLEKAVSESPSKMSQDSRQSVGTFLKFSFQMDSIILNLFTAPNVGLAQFGIYFLSLKGYTLVDGSMSASIVLCDVQLDDTRPNRQNYITKFMKKRDTSSDGNATCSTPDSSMIDIVARIKGDDTFAKLKVSSFDLILSLEYLMKIAAFLTAPEDTAEKPVTATSATLEVPGNKVAKLSPDCPSPQPEETEQKKNIHILLELAEPDIILVEKMDDINCLAIILNTELKLDVRIQGSTQKLKGELADMRIYVCEFNPARRNTTKHFILQPFTASLHGSTTDESGMNISLQTTDVRINVSPGVIEILNKAMTTMTGSSSTEEEGEKPLPDYSDIWEVKELDESKYWFMKIEQAEEVSDTQTIVPVEKKPELCIVEVPSLVLVIETGFGYYTQPMLIIETKLCAEVRDWSSNMAIKSSLALGMAYNNSALATWEPLIEPNERENSNGIIDYHPWELNFDLSIVKNQTEDGEEQPTTKIDIASSDALEMTITKSFLETLTDLGKSFSDAIKPSGLSKPSIIAPYIVENDTGFPITLNLKNSSLHLHSSHLPTSQKMVDETVVFQTKTIEERDIEPHDVTTATISPGGRAYLQPKSDHAHVKLSAFTQQNGSQNVQDMMLYAMIGDIDKEICLPIHKTDQRYFPLYRDTNKEPWGIISNVKTEYGTTVITLHGVLKIFNHFSTTIAVHRIENNEYSEIGRIPAHSEYHVPLHALYAVQKDLFFSVEGYNVSVQGVNWKESPSDFQFKKNLQCDPVSTYEPFYILAIREREEVFHEISSKITMLSACFTIHLRPQLYLKNALPIDVIVSVAGCTVSQTEVIEATEDGSISSRQPNSSSSQKDDFLDYGEKILKPGDLLHLPTVKTYAADGDNKSYVVMRLNQYLEKDWSCTTEIPSNHPDFSVWTFNSYDSVDKMSLELGVHFENCHGTIQATIYCPFWMINKTGLQLSYRPSDESINVMYHPPDYEGPILFSFREKAFFGKKKASLRVDSGEWSDKFALDAAGSTGTVECKANNMTYEIGVHNTLTHNSLTKQVTFVPFFVMMNKAPFAIEVQEDKRPADKWTKIEANQCVPLWPKDESKMLRVRACDNKHVSRPFKFDEVQCTLLKMENQYGGINVDVQVTEGAVFVTFSGYFPGDAPALIINHTNTTISFSEKGNINERQLQPKQEMLYTWTDPAGERIIHWNDDKDKIENDLRRDGVNQFTLPSHNETPIYWVSFLDGTQRVLLFTEETALANDAQSTSNLDKITQDITLHLQGIGISLVNNMKQIDIMYLGIASSGVIWEEKKKNRFKQMKIAECQMLEERYQEYLRDKAVGDRDFKSYHLDGNKIPIDFENMKIRKSNEREIKRTFYPGVWVEMKSSPYQMQLHAKVNRIQIDNQLTDCIFPVVLAPVPPPKSVAATTELKPFIECSIVQRIIPHSNVKQFKYLSMLVQEFHVKVDLLYITEILNMISVEISEEESAERFTEDLKRQQEPLSALVQTFSSQDQKNFYDMLHLGPLKIHISFSMAGMEPSALPGVLSTVLQGIGVTLTDINDVVLRLAFFQREYTFFTQNQLISEITSHYTGQAVKQAYVLIFGLDVIGNPYGLVVGFTKGVEDLFYEPFSGAIQGPGEFAEGLILGVRSLFGHTVGGAAGAVSKITGAMGKGLAALTFDKEYQKKRREQLNKKPANLQEGIARSGKGLVMGVVDGVTGVFTKPISGAKSEGVEGFFKGLGKGAVGLVARPTAGIVDFASGSFDAVKRATEMSEDVNRLRSPRFLHSDGIVRPFSRAQAEGNKLLKEIEKGKYSNTDTFAHYEVIVEKRDVLLVSNHRVLYCIKNDLFGGWQIDWTYRWQEISTIVSTERGVELLLAEKGKKFGLFSSSEKSRKVLLIPQKAKREKLVALMNELRDDALI